MPTELGVRPTEVHGASCGLRIRVSNPIVLAVVQAVKRSPKPGWALQNSLLSRVRFQLRSFKQAPASRGTGRSALVGFSVKPASVVGGGKLPPPYSAADP